MIGENSISSKGFRLALYTPNKQMLYYLADVTDPVLTQTYSGINTLKFQIPSYVTHTSTHMSIKNPVLNIIQPYYLVRYIDEYYIIDKINKSSDMKQTKTEIQASSLGSELKRKMIVIAKTGTPEKPVMNLKSTGNYLLEGTAWTVKNVDASLDLKYRAIDIASKNVLDAILSELCIKWDCVVKFNTIDKTIDFCEYASDGYNSDLWITDNKYLKNITFEMNEDSVCTKMIVTGKDGVTINSVTPNGLGAITDYSNFKNDKYMSIGLITALTNYETALTNANNGTFTTYLADLNTLNTTLLALEHDLDVIKTTPVTGYNAVASEYEIAVATGEPAEVISEIKSRLDTQQGLVTSKQSQISTTNTSIASKKTQIQTLQSSLAITNYLTSDQIQELQIYTFEKTYQDTSITAKGTTIEVLKELLSDTQKQLSLQNQPRYSATIDIVDLLQALNVSQSEKNRLKLGTIINVRHGEMGIDLKCKVVEIVQDFQNYKITIKIANEKDIKSGFTKVKDILKTASNTANFVGFNADAWDRGGKANDLVTNFLNNAIDVTKQTLIGGSDNTVQIDVRGITIVDPKQPQYVLRMNAGAIGLSSDGGETYKVGMSKGVVHAEVLAGKIITGNALTIGDADGLWNQLGAKVTIKNRSNVEVMKIGSYLADDGISERFGIKSMNSIVQVGMDSTDGFWIKNKVAGSWTNVLSSDPATGEFTFKGKVDVSGSMNVTGSLKVNGSDVLTAGKIKAAAIESLEVGKNVTMGAGATISWSQVTNQPTIPSPVTLPSYIKTTYIDGATIQAPNIIGGTITGGTLNTADATAKRIQISTSGISSYNGNSEDGFFCTAGIYDQGSFGIKQNGGAQMQIYWNGMGDGSFKSEGNLHIRNGSGAYSTYFYGLVNFANATVSGLPTVTAKFG